MPKLTRAPLLLLMLIVVIGMGGCLFRTRRVERRLSTAQLQQASQAQLIEIINRESAKIKTLNATVDITPSIGGVKKGKITEYKDIRGYILVRKPAAIRMIGLFPIVRNRAFDMVSDGVTFKLSIPAKNRFYVGKNEIIRPAKQPLENLRPQYILDALMLREVDPQTEVAVLEAGMDAVWDPSSKKTVDEPNYIIDVIHHEANTWRLARKIYFDRKTLMPYRQVVYDKSGNAATVATYDDFRLFLNVQFPTRIEISRPQEEYTIVLDVVSLKLNEPLADDKFQLEQPAGSQLVSLDQPPPEASEVQPGVAPQPAQPPR